MNYQSRPQGNIYSSPHGHPTPSCHGPSPRLPPHNPRLHVTPKHTHVRFHHRVGSYSIQRRASINTFFLHVWIFSWRPNLFWVAWWTALRIWRNIQKEMWRVHRPLEPRWWKCTLCAWLTKSQRHIFVTAFVRYTIRFCRDNFKLSLHSDWGSVCILSFMLQSCKCGNLKIPFLTRDVPIYRAYNRNRSIQTIYRPIV